MPAECRNGSDPGPGQKTRNKLEEISWKLEEIRASKEKLV
jgi:hypothetical protein